MSKSLPQQKTRTVRKGSLWRARGDRSGRGYVRVQFRRGSTVAYTRADCDRCGGVLPYADFMDRYEWLAGR